MTTNPPVISDPQDPKKYMEAPFSYSMANNESVNLANGSLSYRTTDFILPGKNGFDLVISRVYNTDNANLHDMHPQIMGDGSGNTTKRDNQHFVRTFGLGHGWSFEMPSIEIVPESQRLSGITYSTHLHLEGGRSFVVEGSTLKDYPLNDITVAE